MFDSAADLANLKGACQSDWAGTTSPVPMRVAFFSLILLLTALSHGSEWRLIKHGGRDHVTWENMGGFYRLGPVLRSGNKVELAAGSRSLRGEIGSKDLFINNIKFILSYPVAEVGGEPVLSRMDLSKLIEPVMRPSRIKNAEPIDTVVLDPGHGGHDHGARSPYGNEKTYTLDLAQRCKKLLESRGYRVVLTRKNDVFVPLEERVRIANKYDRAVFISLHFNDGGHGTGLETYTLAPRGVPSMAADGPRMSDLDPCTGNARDAENMALATATHAAIMCRTRMFDRGIKRARFVVIRDIAIPGVLVEGGFLSSPQDSMKIATTTYRDSLATGIIQAVNNYKRAITGDHLPSTIAHDAELAAGTFAKNALPAPPLATAAIDESGHAAGD
jgi:N-acetylmuramoyl-L-alanine amidase